MDTFPACLGIPRHRNCQGSDRCSMPCSCRSARIYKGCFALPPEVGTTVPRQDGFRACICISRQNRNALGDDIYYKTFLSKASMVRLL